MIFQRLDLEQRIDGTEYCHYSRQYSEFRCQMLLDSLICMDFRSKQSYKV